MRRAIYRSLLLLAGPLLAPAAGLPPLHGDLSGRLNLRQLPSAPPLAWHVQTEPSPPGLRGGATISAPGLDLRLDLRATRSGAVHWRVTEGAIDLGTWWPHLAGLPALKGAVPADLNLTGTLAVTGEGDWTDAGLTGGLAVKISGATAGSVAQDWSVPDVDLAAEVALAPDGVWLRSVQVKAPAATVGGVSLARIALAATGDRSNRLRVTDASVAAFGGDIRLQPFGVDLTHPAVVATAELANVALSDLAALMPQALSEAQGRVSGTVSVRWNADLGVQPSAGSLHIVSGSRATLRLAASPGFLTGNMPQRIVWLPDWLGGVARWLSLENPAYDTLRRIELGQLPLAVDDLRVELYPDGPDGDRSAVVAVTARPASAGTVVDVVTFDVNVAGPLNQVLRLGTDQRVKLQVGLKP